MVSTEAGALLVRELCEQRGIFERFSRCFGDHGNPLLITHALQALLEQRVYGLICGYEDLNDTTAFESTPYFSFLSVESRNLSLCLPDAMTTAALLVYLKFDFLGT